MTALLSVRDLEVVVPTISGPIRPVRGVSFDLEPGETLCIVGESGCGKSMTSMAVMGLLRPGIERRATRLAFDGADMLGLPPRAIAKLRGDRMAMIFQEPMTSLNPGLTIGDQLAEALTLHRRTGRRAARDHALHLLQRVGVGNPARRLDQYPHELSGGLRQRVMIAMALMCGPALLIADEPTTALDVTIQAQVLRLLSELRLELGMALLMVTHDLGVVARVADRVAVMYAGEFVESARTAELFARPSHPYTRGLLGCIPVLGRQRRGERLGVIEGTMSDPAGDRPGCRFADRCDLVTAECRERPIALEPCETGHEVRCIRWAESRQRMPVAA